MADLWGKLHGVRPVKIARQMLDEGKTESEIIKIFEEQFEPSKEKLDLTLKIAKKEFEILKNMYPNGVSLYISIPFCPSRCTYCSFTSYSAQKYDTYIDSYLDCLEREMQRCGEIIKALGKCVETVYIGGGTPSILSPSYFDRLLSDMEHYFDFSSNKEFSVECGRPDTITLDKLKILRDHGVDRISINPQSMSDKTLQKIGRNHTKKQFLNAYEVARQVGFKCINTDIIAGLPEEDLDDFCSTVDQIVMLKPENITVHTLSVKRSADLMEQKESVLNSSSDTENMLRYSDQALKDYEPYYLYRQKNMVNKLENVGYSKIGFENLYNIYTMDESQTIIALGAGAATKIVNRTINDIERVFNLKDPKEYVLRIDEMLERKKEILTFSD